MGRLCVSGAEQKLEGLALRGLSARYLGCSPAAGDTRGFSGLHPVPYRSLLPLPEGPVGTLQANKCRAHPARLVHTQTCCPGSLGSITRSSQRTLGFPPLWAWRAGRTVSPSVGPAQACVFVTAQSCPSRILHRPGSPCHQSPRTCSLKQGLEGRLWSWDGHWSVTSSRDQPQTLCDP